ncbi:MAG: phosphate propanoyltransferase [Elusimicrobia bacterium]|nr:phosphate propanoyltransferase [Elusimicrobiota bacterium]
MTDTSKIAGEILLRLERSGRPVVCNVSNRHMHISGRMLQSLFGNGYKLKKLKDLMQPGEYASKATVDVKGPKGTLNKVRVLGPVREKTQVEISRTDCYTLGIKAPLRNSGDVKGSPGARLIGPAGSARLKEGIIVAQRHIHMTPEDASFFKVKDRQKVRVRTRPPRSVIFEDMLVRVSKDYRLECHIDTDEANGCDLSSGAEVFLS